MKISRALLFGAALASLAAIGCKKKDAETPAATPGDAANPPGTATGTGTTMTGASAPDAMAPDGAPGATGASGTGKGSAGSAGAAGAGGSLGSDVDSHVNAGKPSATGIAGPAAGAGGTVSGSVTVGASVGAPAANVKGTDADQPVRNVGTGSSSDNIDRKADGTTPRGGGNVGDGKAHPTGEPAPAPKKK